MKQMKCELCGSTDFLKEDGVFVCQYCKTKYSVEEAKKMMIEGKVDVSGSTVKVDSEADIANWYAIARRARENGDTDEAQRYYERIQEKEPDSWEPYFYANLYKILQADNSRIGNAVEKFNEKLTDLFVQILDIPDEKERENALGFVITDTLNVGNAVFQSMLALREKACSVSGYTGEVRNWVFQGSVRAIEMMDNVAANIDTIKNHYSEKVNMAEYEGMPTNIRKTEVDSLVKLGKILNSYETEQLAYIERSKNKIEELIKGVDANYQNQTVKNAGCYIATSVYGSYDCPEVWTLRRFRDYELTETWYGRAFIRSYYAISPTLVRWFGHKTWFRNICKDKLDYIVADLQSKGYEDSPYDDINR